MLILICCALALALWIPGNQRTDIPTIPGWSRWKKSGKTGQREHLAMNEDARVIRELSALLRSGVGFYPALEALLAVEEHTGPVAKALHGLQATHRLNNQPGNELVSLLHSEYQAVQRLHWCLKISEHSGASLAEVLERLAEDLEAALVAQQSFDAAMAGPKATTKLLTWLPLVGFGFGLLVGIDVIGTVISSWAAQLSVAIGAGLWAANRFWCQRLMRSTSEQALS